MGKFMMNSRRSWSKLPRNFLEMMSARTLNIQRSHIQVFLFQILIRIVHSERTWKLLEGSEKKIVCQLGKPDHVNRVFPPVIVGDASLDDKCMIDECFGPILPVRKFTRHDELVQEINARGRPLVIYYFGDQETSLKDTLIKRTRSGTFAMNDCMVPLLNPNLPFGGSGDSGYGCLHTELCHKGMSVNRCIIERPNVQVEDEERDLRYPGNDAESQDIVNYYSLRMEPVKKVQAKVEKNKIAVGLGLVLLILWAIGAFKVTFPHGTMFLRVLGVF